MFYAILPHLGQYRNDTFGPYFDKRAMEHKNMVHYWHFKKKLGLWTPLLNFGGLLDLSFKVPRIAIFQWFVGPFDAEKYAQNSSKEDSKCWEKIF